MPPLGSTFLRVSFAALAVLVAAAVLLLVYRAGRGASEPASRTRRHTVVAALAIGAWMALTWMAAASGVLADFSRRPPPLLLLVLAIFTIGALAAFSRVGTRLIDGLPLWMLVALQSFRLPLELLMHHAATEGVMPPQMSYSGLNFDIVTGITAIPTAWWLARHETARGIALAWNVLGCVLLVNIVTIALLSTPMFQTFGPDRLNVWVAYPPFVWLPAVMVLCALIGHLLIARALRRSAILRPATRRRES